MERGINSPSFSQYMPASDCLGSCVLGIDIKLHPAVLPLLTPLGRSQSLQVQLVPIEVLVEMLMIRWWLRIVLLNTWEMGLKCLVDLATSAYLPSLAPVRPLLLNVLSPIAFDSFIALS